MPIYQYRCTECGFEKEALQKMSDDPLRDCPACGSPSLKKQVTAAAFKLKGTGWYETDFKNSGTPKTDSVKTASNGADGKSSAAQSNSAKSDQSAA